MCPETIGAGSLVGSADYAVFGEARASSGISTLFRFTGEQHDAETGFTYLRARYLNPALGRFVSADSVQPNAPGTQGWNLYAYVMNNPREESTSGPTSVTAMKDSTTMEGIRMANGDASSLERGGNPNESNRGQ